MDDTTFYRATSFGRSEEWNSFPNIGIDRQAGNRIPEQITCAIWGLNKLLVRSFGS